MGKQVIRITLLSLLLCPLALAQTVEAPGSPQPVYLEPVDNTLQSKAATPVMLDGRENSCSTADSVLLDMVVRDHDGHHPHQVPVWQVPDGQIFFFVSGMTIDADGAPNAYSPDDGGLDELANAGSPARWEGIVTDRDGNPLIQQAGDPFPGYYISCTSLVDKAKSFTDPTRYVDATKIPYVVLPHGLADRAGARLGDFAIVTNLRNGKSSFAIYADIGTLGEGSITLADALGIRSDARRGGAADGILYLLFPGSGNLRPRALDEIQIEGEKLLSDFGGMKNLYPCAENDDSASPIESF